MNKPPPRLKPLAPQRLVAGVGEVVLEQVLAAQRQGALDALLRRRPRVTRWCMRRFVAPVLLAAGDAFGDAPAKNTAAVQVLLRWALAQMRPDGAAFEAPIERAAWLEAGVWRPLLALSCHYGWTRVPDFHDRYRASPGESAADRLCGLWDIAPSSFYRQLDRGRSQLAEILIDQPMPSERLISLYMAAQQEAYSAVGLADADARRAWHVRQAEAAVQRERPRAALWHRLQARDADGVTRYLTRLCHQLAADPLTERLLQLLPAGAGEGRTQVRLWLAKAALARVRGAEAAEQRACEQALRVAAADSDPLMLGIAYAALGKFHEARDTDRAFACLQESATFLEQVQDAPAEDGDAPAVAYLRTLVQLAWLHALRNDPRARLVLDRAEALRAGCKLPDDLAATIEQAWGEYWRRSGDFKQALEAQHRALQIYERTGNRQQVLRTYGNLALLYGHLHDVNKAIACSQRVLSLAETTAVDPETVASTHINLGVAHVWRKQFYTAIEHYTLALERARGAALRIVAGRAHYNLAEAYYLRFQAEGRGDDERLGDNHTEAALAAWPPDGDAAAAEATRSLKREVLGQREAGVYDRLLPAEVAAHFQAMTEVQRQRERLAVPQTARTKAEVHLAIAAAYVAIAVKERETALELIEKHRLHAHFEGQITALRSGFDRGLAHERRVEGVWARDAGDLIAPERSVPLLRHLFDSGFVNKSRYAQLCGVGLATASKHLAELARRGLLRQAGRGPRTRYLLPG